MGNHFHFHEPADLRQHGEVMAAINALKRMVMNTYADVKKNLQEIRDTSKLYLDFIIAKDGIIAERDAKIAELAAKVAAGDMTIQEFQTQMADLTTDSQATEDELRAGLPGVPPVGGTPLHASYADRAEFDAAVAAYTGPEAVTVDGTEVKAGTSPALAYFVDASDGSVDIIPPTP